MSMLLHGLLVVRADRIASTPTHLRSPSEPAWHMLLVPAAKGACIIAESVQLIGTCWVEIQIQKMNWSWGFCFVMMVLCTVVTIMCVNGWPTKGCDGDVGLG